MQKLPNVSDKKKGRRMGKEKGTSRQKEEAHSLFSSDRQSENTLRTSGTSRVRLLTTRWLVLSLVALVSVNSMPKYKGYEIKHWTWTNTTKATNTIVKALKYQMRAHIY